MLTQTENKVKIEGIVSEINVREGEFKNKANMMVPYLAGDVKVKVRQDINKVPTEEEIPVKFFVSKFTNAGKENPAYKSVMDLKTNFTSIAASDEKTADRVRITGASLKEEMFYGKNGEVICYPVINASFFTKISKNECVDEASFQTVMCIGNIKEEVDREGELTGALNVQGIIPQWGGKVDVVNFRVTSKEAIEHINANWNKTDTIKAVGKINFSSTTVYEKEELGFGEPIVTPKTISVRELVITGGSPCGFEGDAALDTAEIASALSDRQERIAAVKKQAETPKAPAKKNDFSDLGF